MGTSFHGGLPWKSGRGLICRGLMHGTRFRTGVSPHRGPVGGPGEGGPSTGNFEKWMKGSLGMGCVSLNRLTVDGLKGRLLYWVP
jgi:hypothetical protein